MYSIYLVIANEEAPTRRELVTEVSCSLEKAYAVVVALTDTIEEGNDLVMYEVRDEDNHVVRPAREEAMDIPF